MMGCCSNVHYDEYLNVCPQILKRVFPAPAVLHLHTTNLDYGMPSNMFNKTRNLSESVEVNSNKAGTGHAPNCQAVIVREQIDMGKAGRIVLEWERRDG